MVVRRWRCHRKVCLWVSPGRRGAARVQGFTHPFDSCRQTWLDVVQLPPFAPRGVSRGRQLSDILTDALPAPAPTGAPRLQRRRCDRPRHDRARGRPVGHHRASGIACSPIRLRPLRFRGIVHHGRAIDEMLRSDLDVPKEQRPTARKVLARLVDEHDADGLSYSTVCDHVRKRRPQIAAEAGRPLEARVCAPDVSARY